MFSKTMKDMYKNPIGYAKDKLIELIDETDDNIEITDEEIRYLDNPIFSDTTNAYVIEHNIRYKTGERKKSVVAEGGKDVREELMNNGICSPDICLMAYDIQAVCKDTEQDIVYDRIVVRSEKPLEYWKERFR
jgi:hypothetical protein